MSGSTADNAGRQSGVVAAAAAGIEIVSSDPGAEHGKVWFNSTTSLLKVYNYGAGSWAAGGVLNTPRRSNPNSGAGTLTAAVSFGGYSTETTGETEEYDGTSWTDVAGNLLTAVTHMGGCGTQTAALSFGGYSDRYSEETEEYDGTCWTVTGVGNMATPRDNPVGAGTQSAALGFGGYAPSSAQDATEEYNGSVWGSGGNLLVAVKQHTGCGTQTAGLSTAGAGPVDETEEYDGTCWAASNDLNTARRALTGFGLQTAGLCTGGLAGSSDPRANTEVYNGTTWANDDDLTTPRGDGSQAGTLQAGLVAGGSPASGLNSNTDTTEEYTQSITAQTVTDS